MDSNETRDDLPSLQTAALPVLRDEHLDESEFIEFSGNLLSPDARVAALHHLDTCQRCRQVLAELHRDDGHGSTKLSDPLLGRHLGEYLVEEALSRGGMGVVYRGVQPMIGKKVAIKVLLPDAAEDPDQMHRLLTEARAVNSIRHPNIIDIFSFGDLPDGRHYFIMELLDGLPLDELKKEKGKLSPNEVLTILEQTMSALHAAHGAGVIHRDLKPANLYVTTLPDHTWHVTVLDFGLAKRLGTQSSTSPNLVMGTPGYMAPEQIRGQTVTARTDLYAMGVVAWVLLTGQEPFTSDSYVDLMMKHLQEPLPSLARLAPGCPPHLVALVERLLAKRPENRPGSAAEVLSDVRRVRREAAGLQTMKTPSPVVPINEVLKPHLRATQPVNAAAVVTEVREPPRPGPAPTRVNRPPVAAVAAPQPAADERGTAELPVLSRDAEPEEAAGPVSAGSNVGLMVVAALMAAGIVGLGLWKWQSTRTDLPEVNPTELAVETPPAKIETPPAKIETPPPKVEMPTEEVPKLAEQPTKVVEEPTKVVEAPTKVEAPTTVVEPPSKAVEPTKLKPTTVRGPSPAVTSASVKKRLDSARSQAAKLQSAASRRMLNLDLDKLEGRLGAGEAPRTLNRDLDEVLANYGAR